MKGNTVFRRTLILVLSAVLLCTLLTLLIYRGVSPQVFAASRSAELMPKARLIASLVEGRLRGEISLNRLLQSVGSSTSQWGAYVWVVDPQGNTLLRTRTQGDNNQPVGTLPSALKGMADQVMTGQEASYIGRLDTMTRANRQQNSTRRSEEHSELIGELAPNSVRLPEPEAFAHGTASMVVVGVPVSYDGEVVAAVVMGQTMSEVVTGMRSLTNTLILAMFAAILLLLPLAYLVASRMARPIRQMRDVALAMAAGDFSAKADPAAPGEVGELGGALNYLSSELSRNLSALVVEQERLRRVLNGLTEGILAVDREGQVTHANPAMRSVIPDLAALPETVAAAYAAALHGEVQSFTLQDGETAYHVLISPLTDEERRTSGAVGVFRDVTQEERLEQTRRDYVANVSHELRTPLTALRALIEPLRDGLVQDEGDRERIYGVMLRETLRLSRLVNDMLELSRLQSGALSLEKYPFDPARVLTEVYMKFAPHADDHGQTLKLKLPRKKLPQVLGNADRTEQVLVTLLDNAIKYTPEGKEIRILASVDEDALRISVADDGPGIAPEDIRQVFDRFYKADKAHQGNGTGLGLAIAREILTLLDESITVESPAKGGTVFTFTLHYAA